MESVELVSFSDASLKSIGACVYLRSIYKNGSAKAIATTSAPPRAEEAVKMLLMPPNTRRDEPDTNRIRGIKILFVHFYRSWSCEIRRHGAHTPGLQAPDKKSLVTLKVSIKSPKTTIQLGKKSKCWNYVRADSGRAPRAGRRSSISAAVAKSKGTFALCAPR
ncbi:hypothetical protein EVAR_86022_1 [Eumeta japonica]|uniref:Uncharacterized protein n=1 Tax=Eumeta variegata TaxID=151549 RepID=A0A4C1UK26_EUMVA|nr:hypothetical protein EVAR_86022_1 [Eumeta japonica]